MNPNSPRLPDLLHQSGAHKNRRYETGREPVQQILFCDQCGAPSLEEELYYGICVLCTEGQRSQY